MEMLAYLYISWLSVMRVQQMQLLNGRLGKLLQRKRWISFNRNGSNGSSIELFHSVCFISSCIHIKYPLLGIFIPLFTFVYFFSSVTVFVTPEHSRMSFICSDAVENVSHGNCILPCFFTAGQIFKRQYYNLRWDCYTLFDLCVRAYSALIAFTATWIDESPDEWARTPESP